MPLYDYQIDARNEALSGMDAAKAKNEPYRGLICLPTGAGKTHVAASIIKEVLRRKGRVLFLCREIILIDQTHRSFFHKNGIGDDKIGIVHWTSPLNYECPIQIGSLMTMEKRVETPINFDLVIVDECHTRSKYITSLMKDFPSLPVIGLTASPFTAGLGKVYHHYIKTINMQECIDRGILCGYRIFASSTPERSRLSTQGNDYSAKESEGIMGPLIADIVKNYKKNGERKSALCFASTRKHARILREDFISNGISAGYMDAHTPSTERQSIIKEFENKKIQVICNVGVLTHGFDSDVDCIILAKPTHSYIALLQMVGRGLRSAERDCLIFDHTDSIRSLGLPEDLHRNKLDTSEGKVGSPRITGIHRPSKCPQCQFIKEYFTSLCDECGYDSTEIEVMEGRLEEIKGWGRSRISKTTADEMVSYHHQQFHVAEIATKTNRSEESVRNHLKFRGLVPHKFHELRKNIVIKRVREGVRVCDIAKELGVEQKCVSKIIKKSWKELSPYRMDPP